MFVWESIVLAHLASRGMFVRPQFDIAWDREAREGGTCPDFVAIDPKTPARIYDVEVSTAWSLSDLSTKFENRRLHWFNPLSRQLSVWGHPQPYECNAIAYIRKDAAHFTCKRENDVEVRWLEDIAFAWQ